jgi:hypothetical protein
MNYNILIVNLNESPLKYELYEGEINPTRGCSTNIDQTLCCIESHMVEL